jgi:methionyl aminopeptidase
LVSIDCSSWNSRSIKSYELHFRRKKFFKFINGFEITDKRKLINGDIITVDVSIYYRGYHGDCARTYLIGDCDQKAQHLVKVAKLCLMSAINVCRDGQLFSTIGKTIEKIAKENGLNVVPSFCGHGIGAQLHEPPQILHYDNDSTQVMSENMVFTIEPVITEGERDVVIYDDNWTVSTEDNRRTAQFEHTIWIQKDSAIILTDY